MMVLTLSVGGIAHSVAYSSPSIELNSVSTSTYQNGPLLGINATTIDHRVVDLNYDSWVKNNVITAQTLAGYETIETEAFGLYQKHLYELYLPDSIKTLQAGIFVGAREELKKVVIPAGIKNIEGNIFLDTYPTEVIVKNTKDFEMVNGCLYDKRAKKLLMVLPSAANAKHLIHIKPDTKIIAPYAFSNLITDDAITNPYLLDMNDFKNVEQIEPWAFFQANVQSFNIPANVKNIGEGAFSSFVGTLTSSHPQYELQKFPKYEILHDKKTDTAMAMVNITLTLLEQLSIKLDYTHIGPSFLSSTAPRIYATTFTISNRVKDIGNSAFENLCSKEVIFESPSNLQTIGDFVFSNFNANVNSSLKNQYRNFNITLPDSLITIGDTLFYNSGNGVLNIPSSVQKIGLGIILNSSNININLDPTNPYYEVRNGVIIEKRTKTAIAYDLDYLLSPDSRGMFVIDADIKEIAPRSFTMLIYNPNFQGIEIKNPNIVIGNGAFLNTGQNSHVNNLIVPASMSDYLKRYIITRVMSWAFGPLQDSSITNFGGGSWQGTINGKKYTPLPEPAPWPSPDNLTTNVVLDKAPDDIKSFLPSAFLNTPYEELKTWFSLITPGTNTTFNLTKVSADNLEGSLSFYITINKPLVHGVESTLPVEKVIKETHFLQAVATSITQVKTPSKPIDPPEDIKTLITYFDWTVTTPKINHNGINNYQDKKEIISQMQVAEILNQKNEDGKYLNNFKDGLLHLKIRIDNYYDRNGDFHIQTDTDYRPLILTATLKGFILAKPRSTPQNGNGTYPEINLLILLICLGIIVLLMIISIILMNWKKKRRR